MHGYNKKIIDWLEYGGIMLLVVALPLSESLMNIGFACALIGFMLRRIMTWEQAITWHPFGLGLLFFFLSSLISSFFAQDLFLSLKGAWDVFRFGFVFLLISNDMTAWKKEIVAGLILSIGIGSVWGIYDVYTHEKGFLEILSLGHFNHTGLYLAMMLTIITSLILFDNALWLRTRICLYAFSAVVLVALALTTSRGSFVGLAAALVSLTVMRGGWKGWAALIGIILVFVAVGSYSESFRAKGLSSGSLMNRMEIWKNGYQAFRENPIVGVGMNHFGKIDFERYQSSRDGIAPHAHSLYVNVAVQNGLVGIVALLFVLGGFLKTWRAAHLSRADDFERAMIYSSLGVFCIVVVGGIFNTTLHHEHGMLFSIATAFLAKNKEIAAVSV